MPTLFPEKVALPSAQQLRLSSTGDTLNKLILLEFKLATAKEFEMKTCRAGGFQPNAWKVCIFYKIIHFCHGQNTTCLQQSVCIICRSSVPHVWIFSWALSRWNCTRAQRAIEPLPKWALGRVSGTRPTWCQARRDLLWCSLILMEMSCWCVTTRHDTWSTSI